MTLNIGGTANSNPYFKYSAKSDKWFVRSPDGQDKEIGLPTFAADLANIETGWFKFDDGRPPERVMDPSLQQPAPCPGDKFRRGFVLQAFSPKYFGGLAEIISTSIHLSNVIRDIYAQFAKEQDAHPGKVPLLSCTGSQPMKDRHGTNYRPVIVIINWVERPPEMPVGNDGSSNNNALAPPPEPRRTPDPPGDEPLF